MTGDDPSVRSLTRCPRDRSNAPRIRRPWSDRRRRLGIAVRWGDSERQCRGRRAIRVGYCGDRRSCFLLQPERPDLGRVYRASDRTRAVGHGGSKHLRAHRPVIQMSTSSTWSRTTTQTPSRRRGVYRGWSVKLGSSESASTTPRPVTGCSPETIVANTVSCDVH